MKICSTNYTVSIFCNSYGYIGLKIANFVTTYALKCYIIVIVGLFSSCIVLITIFGATLKPESPWSLINGLKLQFS